MAKDTAQQPEAGRRRPLLERVRWVLDVLPVLWSLVRPRLRLLGLGLALVAVNRSAGLVIPVSTRYVVDKVILARRPDRLRPLVLVLIAAALAQAATSFALTQTLSKGAQRLIAELRERLLQHVVHLPVTFFDAQKSGALVSRILWDVEGLKNLVGTGLVELAGGLIASGLAFAVMFRISPLLTLLTLGFLALMAAGLAFAFARLRPLFRERSVLYAEVAGRLAEGLSGIRVIKGYRREEHETRAFGRGVQRILANVMRTLTAVAVIGVTGSLLVGLASAGTAYMGARLVLAKQMTLGDLFAYAVLLGFLVAPVFQMAAVGTQLTEALTGLERSWELLEERREDDDPHRRVTLPELRGHVTFESVGFGYGEGPDVLHEVSFEAAPGTVTALVGPSGAGKSTLIALVASFHVPRSGRLLVDGVDLRTLRLDSYRSRLGVVLQETFLFDGTIRENVAFPRPQASEDEVREACRVALVEEFVERLERGYDTLVGERGVKLSGGQRQRIAIARALLADPRVLILDEATSSLDTESEAFVQEGLARLLKGRTTFVIAHRLSTIRRADQILVLEAGRIVEGGRHEALLAAGGRYHEMYTAQVGVVSNLFLAPGEGTSLPQPKPPPATPDVRPRLRGD